MMTILAAASTALGLEAVSGILLNPAVGVGFGALRALHKVRGHLPENNIVEIRKEAKHRGGAYQSVVEGWFH